MPEFGAEFADIIEVKAKRLVRTGNVTTEWCRGLSGKADSVGQMLVKDIIDRRIS